VRIAWFGIPSTHELFLPRQPNVALFGFSKTRCRPPWAEYLKRSRLAECGARARCCCRRLGVTGNRSIYHNQVFWAVYLRCGRGAHGDAWWTVGQFGNAGMCFLDSRSNWIEIRLPSYVLARGLCAGYEGAGRNCGCATGLRRYGRGFGSMSLDHNSDWFDQLARKGVRGGGWWRECRSAQITVPRTFSGRRAACGTVVFWRAANLI